MTSLIFNRQQHLGVCLQKRGFSLVEMLVVLAVISILAGVSLPLFKSSARSQIDFKMGEVQNYFEQSQNCSIVNKVNVCVALVESEKDLIALWSFSSNNASRANQLESVGFGELGPAHFKVLYKPIDLGHFKLQTPTDSNSQNFDEWTESSPQELFKSIGEWRLREGHVKILYAMVFTPDRRCWIYSKSPSAGVCFTLQSIHQPKEVTTFYLQGITGKVTQQSHRSVASP